MKDRDTVKTVHGRMKTKKCDVFGKDLGLVSLQRRKQREKDE